MTPKTMAWYTCIGGVVLLCALCFTPLVIPAAQSEPRCFGLPRTLWLGMLIYGLLVLLTFVATRFLPSGENEREET